MVGPRGEVRQPAGEGSPTMPRVSIGTAGTAGRLGSLSAAAHAPYPIAGYNVRLCPTGPPFALETLCCERGLARLSGISRMAQPSEGK